MKDYIGYVVAGLVVLLVLFFTPKLLEMKKDSNKGSNKDSTLVESPDVWIGPDCPVQEPKIVTVPVERVVEKVVYINRSLTTGCHVSHGKVFGVMEQNSTYRLECYLQSDGTVRAKYVDMSGALGLR